MAGRFCLSIIPTGQMVNIIREEDVAWSINNNPIASSSDPTNQVSYYSTRNDNSYVSYSVSNFNPVNYIGSTMQSSNNVNGYYSNSQWNKGMKWAILGACNQLTHLNHNKKWARVLLGKQKRTHGVLGYQEAAPVGPADYRVVDEFFYSSYYQSVSILQAWFSANLSQSYVVNGQQKLDKSAALVHYQYRNEGFGAMYSSDPGPVSSRFDSPDIRLYKSSMNSSESISLSSSQIQAIINNVENTEDTTRDALHVDDTLMFIEHELKLDKMTSLSNEQIIDVSLHYALGTDFTIADALSAWEFFVYEIVEERVDVLEEGIDAQPTIVGYMVMAIDPNDESNHEYVKENGVEELRVKNCFTAMIDGNGVCSASFKAN